MVHLLLLDVSNRAVVARIELLPRAPSLKPDEAASHRVRAPPQHLGVVTRGHRESVGITIRYELSRF